MPPMSIWQWKPCERAARCVRRVISAMRYGIVLTEGVPEKADELNARSVPTVMEPVLVTVREGFAERWHRDMKGQ
jgi:hypothetical protein